MKVKNFDFVGWFVAPGVIYSLVRKQVQSRQLIKKVLTSVRYGEFRRIFSPGLFRIVSYHITTIKKLFKTKRQSDLSVKIKGLLLKVLFHFRLEIVS